MNLFADFHIHIGQSHGRPVKMAAAPSLTLSNLITHARQVKGLDVVTVIDGVCDGPLEDVRSLIARGELVPLPNGGLVHENGLVLILGSEIEVAGPHGGAAHFGCWFPSVESAEDFSGWLKTVQKNTTLSSQRAYASARELQAQVMARGGIFIVHHAFTPHKGLYGNCVDRLSEMVDPVAVDALELGLSSDTLMADTVSDLSNLTYLSNSDAHSVQKIAREYNQLRLVQPDFHHIQKALNRTDDANQVIANFGLDPRLGKYHETACKKCGRVKEMNSDVCACGGARWIVGVSVRLKEIADLISPLHPPHRPPYIHQVPLEFIPGLGPKARERLFEAFGTEMNILHRASREELSAVVGERLMEAIDSARQGKSIIVPGFGGVYGKIM